MNILVVASHFDDEVLGCGGTIAKHVSEGDSVHVLFLTDSCSAQYPGNKEIAEKKRNECLEANRILGSTVEFLDFPDMKLDTVPHIELNNAISKVVEKFKPEIVYTHWKGDLNKDHRLAHESTMVACRPSSGVNKILCYEVPSSTEWGEYFNQNVFVDITYSMDTKLMAVACYKSELRDYPHPRNIDSLCVHAKSWGQYVGAYAAEAFVLVREVL